MLKYTYEDQNTELKTWVDPNDGSINFQIGKDSVKVPYEIGAEIITTLKSKQSAFLDKERQKLSFWTRFNDVITQKTNLSEIWS